MGKLLEEVHSRRDFFTTAFRYAASGTLGAVGGFVALKRRRLVKEGKCVNGGICRGCEVFGECVLPQALSAKEVQGDT